LLASTTRLSRPRDTASYSCIISQHCPHSGALGSWTSQNPKPGPIHHHYHYHHSSAHLSSFVHCPSIRLGYPNRTAARLVQLFLVLVLNLLSPSSSAQHPLHIETAIITSCGHPFLFLTLYDHHYNPSHAAYLCSLLPLFSFTGLSVCFRFIDPRCPDPSRLRSSISMTTFTAPLSPSS